MSEASRVQCTKDTWFEVLECACVNASHVLLAAEVDEGLVHVDPEPEEVASDLDVGFFHDLVCLLVRVANSVRAGERADEPEFARLPGGRRRGRPERLFPDLETHLGG